MARGKEVDRDMVALVLQMKARNPKLTTEQIGAVVKCDATTAGRIIKTGSWEAYNEWKAEKARKEREKKAQPAEELEREPEVPGQIEMDLQPKAEMSDQTKMMRFTAGQVDKLYMKLETINDTLSQILRAIRGE